MSVVGFDIGNESCAIAAARSGSVDVLLNGELKNETPSVVSFGKKQRFFGAAGAASALANTKSTISHIKRLIGRQYKEPSVQKELKFLPFVTSEGPRGGILIELEYMKETLTFTPVAILGMLFKYLKQIAEKNLEFPVADCVIGIPSYFTDLQRREYLDAAAIAGLNPLRLMHDGTAIALGYGLHKTDLSDVVPTIVMFVDIGHCDTQVTVAAFKQGQMKILAHSFDNNLGGRDFDEVLFKHFAAQFEEKYEIDVSSNARASIMLRASCEKVKKVLSNNPEAPMNIECLIEDKDVRGIITKEEFENLSQELLERVMDPCVKAIHDSGISHDKIYIIELVGSGSHIPAITKRLTSLFQREPTRTLNASECVARGCALRCAMLTPTIQFQDYKFQDIFPYSIVLPANQSKSKQELTLFAKGSPFPNYHMLKCNGMTLLDMHVFYANDKNFPAGMSTKVGNFRIDSSESSGKGKVGFEFKVLLNENGVVEIDSSSIIEDNNRSRKNNIPHPKKMVANSHMSNITFSENLDVTTTKDELRKAQEIEKMLAEQDIKVEQAKDQRNTLQSFVYDTRSKLSNAYRSFTTDAEKDGITQSLQETEDWLYEDSDDETDEQNYSIKLEYLKKLLDPIEKRIKDEIAREKATKAIRTFIEDHRSATELMPHRHKDMVGDQCLKAEQWLNLYQQQAGFKNMDPIRWASVTQEAMDKFEWNFKVIMNSKPSSPKHEHMDKDQRDQCVDQSAHPVDSTHMGSNQRNQTQDRLEGIMFQPMEEQDIKMEQTKDQRNTLESFVHDTRSKLLNVYRSFATDAEKDGITKTLQETEDWLYEDSDDESDEQNYSGKLEGLKQLLGPIEKRSKDENERLKATKALRTDLLAPVLKHELHLHLNNMVVNTNVSNDVADHKLSDPSLSSTSYTNVTGKNRGEIKNIGVSGNVLGERRENKLSEAQVTKHMLAEKDIHMEQTKEKIHGYKALSYHNDECKEAKQQQHPQSHKSEVRDDPKEADSGKLGDPVKLSRPVENKNKDENAREQATKDMLTCLEEYRLVAGSLPPGQKEEVNIECNRVEQWLHDLSQQNLSNKNINPLRWSSIIKNAMESFERRCKRLMT